MNITLTYMVAGLSSRFGGKMKQFAKVGPARETLIEYSLKQALPARFTKIIFIVGEKTQKPFFETFKNNYKGIPVEYALQQFDTTQRDRPWGTVDALCTADTLIKEPFIVCNGDDIYGTKTFAILLDFLKNNKENATIGYPIEEVLPKVGKVNRGIFKTEKGQVTKIVEHFDIEKDKLTEKNLDKNSLVSMNIFALQPEVLPLLKTALDNFKKEHANDRKKECLLPHELSQLIEHYKIKMRILTTPDPCIGITNPEDEEKVREQLREK